MIQTAEAGGGGWSKQTAAARTRRGAGTAARQRGRRSNKIAGRAGADAHTRPPARVAAPIGGIGPWHGDRPPLLSGPRGAHGRALLAVRIRRYACPGPSGRF